MVRTLACLGERTTFQKCVIVACSSLFRSHLLPWHNLRFLCLKYRLSRECRISGPPSHFAYKLFSTLIDRVVQLASIASPMCKLYWYTQIWCRYQWKLLNCLIVCLHWAYYWIPGLSLGIIGLCRFWAAWTVIISDCLLRFQTKPAAHCMKAWQRIHLFQSAILRKLRRAPIRQQ